METVKHQVLDRRAKTSNEDVFLAQLEELVKEKGLVVCQAIFDIFANLRLSPENAKTHWGGLLRHRDDMTQSLGRPVHLVSVMCDYLLSHQDLFSDPILVEMSRYEQVGMGSTHDHLTGLYNRSYLINTLNQQLALAERNQNDLSILFIDADDFKDINDSLGHSVGDRVLQFISKTISEEIRQSDVAARYGGEEFVILMPLTNSIDALILADRIRLKIAEGHFEVDGTHVPVTISGGISSFPYNGKNTEELINLADSALYRAKGAGKNNISLFKQDNRRFLRINLREKIQIKELGFSNLGSFSGVSKDICVGGILFENSAPLALQSKIQISVPIGGEEPILLIGTVVRIEALAPDRYDIGVVIAFKEMDKLAKNEISRFLVSQAEKSLEKEASD